MKPLRPARTLGLALATGTLAFPVVVSVAAPAAGLARVVGTRTLRFGGATEPAAQWGTVSINVTLRVTAAGARRFTDLGGGYTYHTARSQFIMSQALPLLRQEFLQAQSANVQMVSGATYTSEAFVQSLQSALSKASAAKSA